VLQRSGVERFVFSVRLDAYLKVTRLVPRRSGAGDLCREGKVEVNGRPAKAGRTVCTGDRIRTSFPGREVLVEVTDIPARKNVSKVEARTHYTIIEEKRFDLWGREIVKDTDPNTARGNDTS